MFHKLMLLQGHHLNTIDTFGSYKSVHNDIIYHLVEDSVIVHRNYLHNIITRSLHNYIQSKIQNVDNY